ncbi:protein of unknown function [Paraburkholderia kururiensis]
MQGNAQQSSNGWPAGLGSLLHGGLHPRRHLPESLSGSHCGRERKASGRGSKSRDLVAIEDRDYSREWRSGVP